MKRILAVMLIMVGLAAVTAEGAVVADLRADYVSGTIAGDTSLSIGIADTAGDGSWNYYKSDTVNIDAPASQSALLAWGLVGSSGSGTVAGYGGGVGSYNFPCITEFPVFPQNPVAEPNELVCHPADPSVGQMVNKIVWRWATGASSVGVMTVKGAIVVPLEVVNPIEQDSVDLHVLINGVTVNTITPPHGQIMPTSFNFDITVAAGDMVDFVVDPRTDFSRDTTYLSVQVSNSEKAFNPSPGDGAVDVTVAGATLSWITGQDPANPGSPNPLITGHQVYFGPDADNLTLVATLPVGTTSYAPTLSKDSSYAWRIDEVVSGGVIAGDVWTFDTELSYPVIDTQPVDTLIKEGENGTLTVAATDPLSGTLGYQWYYDSTPGVPGGEDDLENGTVFSGVDTNTLTLLSAASTVEGSYYCEVSNLGGTVVTDTVEVFVGRELYYWPFDGNAVEANGSGYNGTGASVGTDNGLVGGAAEIAGVEPMNFGNVPVSYPGTGQFTISYWVLPDVSHTAIYRPHYIKWGVDGSTRKCFYVGGGAPGYLDLHANVFYNASSSRSFTVANALSGTEWSHVVLTYDGVGSKVYVNGEFLRGYDNINYYYVDYNVPLIMGQDVNPAYIFWGKIDETRIYNYGLSHAEVAMLYTSIAGGDVCVYPPDMDFDDDCLVTLTDFAQFAAQWLDCGLVPTCSTP